MLKIDDRIKERLAADRAFAATLKIEEQNRLESRLEYLATYACGDDPAATECHLGPDFAPHSYSFTMMKRATDGTYRYWFNGGLIFHGQHDGGGNGGAPTFSVSLTPCNGWSIHT